MAINVKSPSSYFFTDPAAFSQSPDDAFRPIDENNFQVTTTFSQALNAYAVTDGILLIGVEKQIDGQPPSNRINIILRPTNDIGIGIKIKYFVYRGIDATALFKNPSGTVLVNKTSTLPFIQKALDAFQEFNQTNADLEASKIGLIDINTSVGITIDILKKYFSKGSYNLLKVEAGALLGKFLANAGGFEIVLDDGDYVQEKSDTGLHFNENFIRARKTVIKADGNQADTTIFGGNVSGASPKLFRENIYKFLDPAAFYGLHTREIYGEGSKAEIKIKGQSNGISSGAEIFSKVINRFINPNRLYIYIKNNLNRSLHFYDIDTTLNINGNSENLNLSSIQNKAKGWPIIIYDSPILNIQIRKGLQSNIYCNLTLVYKTPAQHIQSNIIADSIQTFTVAFPKKDSMPFSSVLYINQESNINDINQIFGPITLDSIFEEGEFTDIENDFSWITHLRNLLVRRGSELSIYNTKVVIDSANKPVEKRLKTFFLGPFDTTIQPNSTFGDKLQFDTTAGYIKKKLTSSKEYCDLVLNQKNTEIWRGNIKINSSTSIKSLVIRKDNNIDSFPFYMLGISQADYESLIAPLPSDANNVFIKFGANTSSGASQLQFARYNILLSYDYYDSIDGLIKRGQTTTGSIEVYSVDNQLFFSKNYSDHFQFYNEFADITVDFRPQNKWMQYFNYPLQATKTALGDSSVFYGFDWLRKGDSERRGKIGTDTTVSSTDDVLLYRISELYSVNGIDYHNFFENIAEETPTGTVAVNKSLYVNVKAMYRCIPTSWKLPNGDLFSNNNIGNSILQTEPDNNFDKDYAPSWLNIPRSGTTNPTIKLRLKIRKRNNVYKALKLFYDPQYFKIKTLGEVSGSELVSSMVINTNVNVGSKLNTELIGVVSFRKGDQPSGSNKMKWIDIELENIAPISQLTILNVMADDKFLAGKLYITPNSNLNEKKILVVRVKDTDSTAGTYDPHEIELVKKFAAICNIKIVEVKIIDIDLTDPGKLLHQFIQTDTAYNRQVINFEQIKDGKTFAAYLESLVPEYSNYVKAFYFGLPSHKSTPTSGILGHTSQENGVISMFNTLRNYNSTHTTQYFYALSHEFLHSQGVSHSFSSSTPADPNALLTYLQGTTNNVMDYNNDRFNAHMFVQNVFFWQWAIAYKNSITNK